MVVTVDAPPDELEVDKDEDEEEEEDDEGLGGCRARATSTSAGSWQPETVDGHVAVYVRGNAVGDEMPEDAYSVADQVDVTPNKVNLLSAVKSHWCPARHVGGRSLPVPATARRNEPGAKEIGG